MNSTKPMTDILAIIPARYDSARLPGKPLALIGGKPMIRHVFERASEAFDSVIIATDSLVVAEAATAFGASVIMTSADIANGTERCAAALKLSGLEPDIVVNVQGDEPFVDPYDLRSVAQCCTMPGVDIATAARRFIPADGIAELQNPSNVKVVFDNDRNALYFSRSMIPYVRDLDITRWPDSTEFHIHSGIYAFRRSALLAAAALPPSPLDRAEKLEQLRWLSAGMKIRIVLSSSKTIGIDTPDDLAYANELYRKSRQ
ncbi:MAG: 3-deoxy-manno-octulosonate cytidylyltransferase [Bacteroides sp.]|nr:3-deoxy-manno-octulosonate cytidylyltransferase [Bacteroides sp.]MCM1412836.1 3-deoxy-manno-octulosonate cytidylyltransferase [Bacteroides sp.]MCM1471505.1 3-deoxy-manno-octulosonate cytidylyltransferase [Bacteroides sp.]